jgi:hypothetical protein
MTAITITEALHDQNLLGAGLGDPSSWRAWHSVLKAAFGLPLAAGESETFKALVRRSRRS